MSQLDSNKNLLDERFFSAQGRLFCFPVPRNQGQREPFVVILVGVFSFLLAYASVFAFSALGWDVSYVSSTVFLLLIFGFTRVFPYTHLVARQDRNCVHVRYLPDYFKNLAFLDSGLFSLALNTIRFEGKVSSFEIGKSDIEEIIIKRTYAVLKLRRINSIPAQSIRIYGPGPYDIKGSTFAEFCDDLNHVIGEPTKSVLPPLFPYYLVSPRKDINAHVMLMLVMMISFHIGSAVAQKFALISLTPLLTIAFLCIFIPLGWQYQATKVLIHVKQNLLRWGVPRTVTDSLEQNMIGARGQKLNSAQMVESEYEKQAQR